MRVCTHSRTPFSAPRFAFLPSALRSGSLAPDALRYPLGKPRGPGSSLRAPPHPAGSPLNSPRPRPATGWCWGGLFPPGTGPQGAAAPRPGRSGAVRASSDKRSGAGRFQSWKGAVFVPNGRAASPAAGQLSQQPAGRRGATHSASLKRPGAGRCRRIPAPGGRAWPRA